MAREADRRGYTTFPVSRGDYHKTIGHSFDLLINANGNSRKYLARQNPEQDFELSVTSVENSLSDVRAEQYVYLSSVDVYPDVKDPALNHENVVIDPDRLSPYGHHKFLAEKLVRQGADNWLIARLAGMVGPGLWKNSIYDLLVNRPLRVQAGSAYQYAGTDATAALVFDLIESGLRNDTVNVSADGLISMDDVARLIPGRVVQLHNESAPLERYDISIAKLADLLPVPKTVPSIQRFIEDVLAGRTTIA